MTIPTPIGSTGMLATSRAADHTSFVGLPSCNGRLPKRWIRVFDGTPATYVVNRHLFDFVGSATMIARGE